MDVKTDVLIIGSGIAGLFSAIKISDYAKVTVVTKKNIAESNTNYAQGGIASVIDPDDAFEKHIEDTLGTGQGLGDREVIELCVKEGPGRIQELIDIGVDFTKKKGKLHLAKEGGHTHKRIVHAKDLTGKEVERALIDKAQEIDNITIIENALAIDLITEHNVKNLKYLPIDNRHCWGAFILENETNTVLKIISKAVVIATGGIGQVYLHTTNPLIATGDGHAMAFRAGAKMANMEFVQFHPTSFYNSSSKADKNQAFLISEALRGYGAKLRTIDSKEFMHKYDDRKELAPRDIVARAIDNELKKRGEDYVYLDITHKPAQKIQKHFPNIYNNCLKFGIDITTECIPVVPAAHYACGGILTDKFGRSSLAGLYAIGEVAMTGLHGANRLASNSLLEALVFAHTASIDLKQFLASYDVEVPDIPDWDDSGTLTAEEKVLVSHGKKELQQLMWDLVGIVRSNLRLEFGARRVETIYHEVEAFYKKTKVFDSLIELRNLITCAHMIIKSASLRKESRGLHYTLDYPEPNTEQKPVNTIIRNTYQKS